MCTLPKGFALTILPNGAYIKLVTEHKYLGMPMCNSNPDDAAKSRQLRNLYYRGNTVRKNLITYTI